MHRASQELSTLRETLSDHNADPERRNLQLEAEAHIVVPE